MAFVTGSFAYGTPKEDSDIDLVVLVSEVDRDRLVEAAGHGGEEDYPNPCGVPLRFGRLNLMVCVTKEQFACWQDGTRTLKKRKPVSRKEAVQLFGLLRRERGLG